ncbi:MAG: phosphate/phosphite/phosphonate ABC transporter substrate-binding protein [Euzebyales bacterium]|nr:phosphate/phosphite/phosphonate ABC transporter substrate-binding protein [Euzebyales bacterium]
MNRPAMYRRPLVLLLLGLALMVAACGGDDAASPDDDTAATDDPGAAATDDDDPAAAATDDGAAATDDATDDAAGTDDATDDATDEAAAAGGEDWPDSIVFGLVPSREADVIIESAQPLADALSAELGIEVESVVPQDYTGLTEAMGTGQADIGAFGPLGIVRAQERAGVELILQSERFGSATYHTQYMTNNPDKYCSDEVVEDEDGFKYCNGTLDAEEGPAGEESIASVDGTLSFVDPTSASGYLIPALQMIEAGVDIDSLDSTFAGGHDNSVLAVNSGDVEVGLSFDDARTTVIEEAPDVADNVVVFAYSEEIPNDGFVVRGDLPDDLKQAITDALLEYSATEEGQETLNAIYEIDALVPADDASLDVIRRADEELGDSFEGE